MTLLARPNALEFLRSGAQLQSSSTSQRRSKPACLAWGLAGGLAGVLAFNASNGRGGGFAFVNGADEVARGKAVTDQPRIDTGPLQRLGQRVVGEPRRRPQK